MGGIAAGQQDIFTERLRRIQHGDGFTAGTVCVGPAETVRTRPSRLRALPGRRFLADLVCIPAALVLGAIALLAGRIGAFQILARPDLLSAEMMSAARLGADIAIGAVLLLLLGWSFGLSSGLRRLALICGFAATMVGEAQVYALAPEVFASLTSDAFVRDVVTGETHARETLESILSMDFARLI